MRNYKSIIIKTANYQNMTIDQFFGINDAEPTQVTAAAIDPKGIPQGSIIFDFDAKGKEKLLDVVVRGKKTFTIDRSRTMGELVDALKQIGLPSNTSFFIKRKMQYEDATPRMREVVLTTEGRDDFE